MKEALRRLQREWEKALFWLCLLALGATAILWLAGFAEGEQGLVSTPAVPPMKPILGENAFAFREAPPNITMQGSNPFGFFKHVRQEERRLPWRGNPVNKWPGERAQRPAPKVTHETTPAPPARHPAPPKPKRFVEIGYFGLYEGPTRQPRAFIQAMDSRTKKSTTSVLAKGATIHDGIKVSAFTGSSLEVQEPNGKALTIPIGKQKKIFLE